MYEIGDKVFLSTDPQKDEGIVEDILHGRYFVRWNNGRTWIYPASWLSPSEETKTRWEKSGFFQTREEKVFS